MRYKVCAEAFAKANGKHELHAMAQYQLAGVIRGERSGQAREVALAGMNAFDSPGGKLCFNLVQDIEAKSSTQHRARVDRPAAGHPRHLQEHHEGLLPRHPRRLRRLIEAPGGAPNTSTRTRRRHC